MPKALPPDQQSTLDMVLRRFGEAESRHQHHVRNFAKWYRQYRSYKEVKRQWVSAQGSARDVDDVLADARSRFGQELFIPYTFSIIESTLPRMLSQNPRLLVTPADPESEANIDGIKLLVDRQQTRVDYPLVLQDVGKSGLIYGLGVQKLPWTRETHSAPRIEPGLTHEWVQSAEPVDEIRYEGPRPECVDVFDFLWDPYAWDMRTAGWVIHRTWRSRRYCEAMFAKERWTLPPKWDVKDALEDGARRKYDEVWADRLTAQGLPNADERRGEIHEVLEFHDGEKVCTVLDRALPVTEDANPYWHGEIMFQIYRPTRVPHEFVGIGEPEAIEDLQQEMNDLRKSRRDNARLVLQRPFAYFDGLVDPGDLQFGPGIAIPVDGNPQELLFPLPLEDVPFSSFREEENLQGDIERTSGVDDSTSGAGSTSNETATGVQLVQAAAGIRIQNKTKLLEKELVKPTCWQWVRLNQQKITSTVYVPGPPKPEDGDREWSWYPIGPGELAGTFDAEPEGGSLSPENEAAKAQKGQQLAQIMGMFPGVLDPAKVATYVLEHFGVKNPERMLAPQEPEVPQHVLDQVLELVAQQLGPAVHVDPAAMLQQLHGIVAQVVAQDQAAQQQGPGGPPQGPPAPPQQPPA